MSRIKKNTVVPLLFDKYYVYALFKPQSANPFYIGKGKNMRVNDHFKPSNLKVNSPKVGVIKKYGNTIRREILCYFDREEDAYDFEEYLIRIYGLQSEGGFLTNYAKSRYEYSDKFTRDVSSTGHMHREVKYSEDVIREAYHLHFVLCEDRATISEKTGIARDYLGYVLRGEKRRGLFKEYTEDPGFIDNRTLPKERPPENKKIVKRIGSLEIMREFSLVCSGAKSLEGAATTLGTSSAYLGEIFSGRKRAHLNLDTSLYKSLGRSTLVEGVRSRYEAFCRTLEETGSLPETYKRLGIPRTTAHRLYRRYKSDGLASDTGGLNGTGDSASEGDNSVANNET